MPLILPPTQGQIGPDLARMRVVWAFASLLLATAFAPSARAALSAEELAKLAQNPIANLVSVPFQNNTNLNYGPEGGTQNIRNIQPVIPGTLNRDWNLITRSNFLSLSRFCGRVCLGYALSLVEVCRRGRSR